MAKKLTRVNARKFLEQLDKRMVSRLGAVGALLKRDIVRSISKPFRTGGKSVLSRNKKGQFKSGLTVRYHPYRRGIPSRPGEPPRADLGRLRKSIFFQVKKKGWFRRSSSVIVGTTLKYGRALEFGTSRMAARPYIRPAYHRNYAMIRTILTAPAKVKPPPKIT